MVPTAADERALQAIHALAEARDGIAPTVREIAEAVGYASPNTAHERVRRLTAFGWITHVDRSPRSINVTDLGRRQLVRMGATPEQSPAEMMRDALVRIRDRTWSDEPDFSQKIAREVIDKVDERTA